MSKYSPLGEYLSQTGSSVVQMNFQDIEGLLGFSLPPSARSHRAWWSNNTSNGVMTNAWLNAGFKSENVDMVSERLVFRRVQRSPELGGNEVPSNRGEYPNHWNENGKSRTQKTRQSIVGALKGTVTFEVGIDLTAPIDVHWHADA